MPINARATGNNNPRRGNARIDPENLARERRKRERNSKILVGVIIGANVVVYGLWNSQYVLNTSLYRPIRYFMMRNFCVNKASFLVGRWWTLISHALSHREFLHLTFNMVGVWSQGIAIGKQFGPVYILGIYILGAVGGAAAGLLMHPSHAYMLGASGATFALLTALAVADPGQIYSTIPFRTHIPLRHYTVGLLACETACLVLCNDGVSHAGHIGGAVAGALAGLALLKFGKKNTV